jgi:hypothetical protein
MLYETLQSLPVSTCAICRKHFSQSHICKGAVEKYSDVTNSGGYYTFDDWEDELDLEDTAPKKELKVDFREHNSDDGPVFGDGPLFIEYYYCDKCHHFFSKGDLREFARSQGRENTISYWCTNTRCKSHLTEVTTIAQIERLGGKFFCDYCKSYAHRDYMTFEKDRGELSHITCGCDIFVQTAEDYIE